MSYTELEMQPDWWIERMLIWLKQKGKAAEHKQKVNEMAKKS